MSVLNRSMFKRGYAEGGIVENEPTARGYLESKGIPVTPESLARATELLTQAQNYDMPASKPGVQVIDYGGMFETRPLPERPTKPQTNEERNKIWLEQQRKKQKEGIYEPWVTDFEHEIDDIPATPKNFTDWLTTPEGGLETKDSFNGMASDLATGAKLAGEGIVNAIKNSPEYTPSDSSPDKELVVDKFKGTTTPPVNPENKEQATEKALKSVMNDVVNPVSAKASEEVSNLRSFANELNVDLSDPYDAWAYIRDMSAGLLASNDNTFLGALGDAALLSNKNRRTAEAAHKELKTKLAIANWKNKEDWAQLKYKTTAELSAAKLKDAGVYKKLPGGSKKTSKDNVDTDWFPVIGDVSQLPDYMVRWEGNQAFVMEFTDNEAARLEQRRSVLQSAFNKIETGQISGKEDIESQIDAQLMMKSFNGELLLSMKGSDIYNELAADLIESQEEGVRELGNLLDSGDADADAVSRAIMAVPQVLKQLGGSVRAGMTANLVPGEYAIIRNEAMRRAKQAAVDQAKEDSFTVFNHSGLMTDAVKSTVDAVNWDGENFQFKYAFNDATTGQMREAQETSEDMRGVGWWSLQGAPNYNKGYAPFHRTDENSWINKDQIELLNVEDRNQVHADMGSILNKLTRAGVPNDKAKWDVVYSYDDSNLIMGGEDVPFSGNLSSRYKAPSTWYMEPESYMINGKREDTSDFRDKGIFWNGFTGEWFTFKNERRFPVDPTKQSGVTVSKPKAIGL